MTAARTRRSTGATFRRLESFVRDYAGGVSAAEVRRHLDRDAARAWSLLARDHGGETEPPKGLRRWLYRARVLFLGISFRLSPPRRILFLISLVAAILALGNTSIRIDSDTGARVLIDLSGLWFTVAFGGLLYLLVVELVDRALVRDELDVARAVQRDLMPAAAPVLPGWRFEASYRTANEVGGDAYDFLPLADGRLGLAIADASGHGMGAGLVMAIASATLRTAAAIDARPAAVVPLVHAALRRMGSRRNLLTLFYARLDPADGGLEWACAGHPFPLLRRRSGEIEEVGAGALPLGVRAEPSPATGATSIAPGDLLVLYTDGLVETLGADGAAFGHDRLRAALAGGGSAAELHQRVLAAFAAHLGGEPLGDDLSLVVVERASDPAAG